MMSDDSRNGQPTIHRHTPKRDLTIGSVLWRLRVGVRGYGVRLGILRYRPIGVVPPSTWDDDYGRGEWDRLGDLAEAARYSVLLGYLELAGDAPSILDVGCGVGLFREKLGPRSFGRYLGIDVSSAAIDRALSLLDERTEFRVGQHLPVESGPFDVVVCNEVLDCVESPPETLDSILGLLAPGGYLLTSLWRHQGDSALHKMIDSRFELIDRVELRNLASSRLRWQISCHRRANSQ